MPRPFDSPFIPSNNIWRSAQFFILQIKHSCFLWHNSQGLIMEASWSHSDTPHSVGFLCSSDQPDAETSTWQHTALSTDKHPCRRRDSNPQSQRAATDQALDHAATAIGLNTNTSHVCFSNLILCLGASVFGITSWSDQRDSSPGH